MESVFVLQSMFFHERILFVKPGVRCNRTHHTLDLIYITLLAGDMLMIQSLKNINPKTKGMVDLFDMWL